MSTAAQLYEKLHFKGPHQVHDPEGHSKVIRIATI